VQQQEGQLSVTRDIDPVPAAGGLLLALKLTCINVAVEHNPLVLVAGVVAKVPESYRHQALLPLARLRRQQQRAVREGSPRNVSLVRVSGAQENCSKPVSRLTPSPVQVGNLTPSNIGQYAILQHRCATPCLRV
jgi:hypothetical protein